MLSLSVLRVGFRSIRKQRVIRRRKIVFVDWRRRWRRVLRRDRIFRVVLVVSSPSAVDARRCGLGWRRTAAALDPEDAVDATGAAHHRDQQGGYGTEKDLREIVHGGRLLGDPAERRRGTAVLFVAAERLVAVHDAVVDELAADAGLADVLLAAELFCEVGALCGGGKMG